MRSLALRISALLILFSIPKINADETTNQLNSLDFNRDIRPLLSDRCFACHGPDASKREANVRLDLPPDQGALDRKIIVAHKPEESELIARIVSDDVDSLMPPPHSGKKLSVAERQRLEAWIRQGAKYESHWAWAPLKTKIVPHSPVESSPQSATNPIDFFLSLESSSIRSRKNDSANSYALLRRLSFDLTGLPPSPADLQWLKQQLLESRDSSASHVEDVIHWDSWIDKKMASPAFGERMAIWWLDLVRYADTVGYHGDQEHHAAPYRDWVIRAFNDNLPFDEFSRFQLAGDRLPASGEMGKIASAYNRLLQTSHEGGVQAKEYLAKYSADRVRNFSQVWLGLTVGCAECHDHKFDPITQREFYQLAAFFADIDELQTFKGGDSSPTKRYPELDVLSPLDGITKMRVMVSDSVEPREIRVLPRGNWLDESGEIVPPGVPAALSSMSTSQNRVSRLELANWLFKENQALTARVTVNRIWSLFFSQGISDSLEDFGAQGFPPTHPELLDWLAREWIDSGWDIKYLVRKLVTSNAYRRNALPKAIESELAMEHGPILFQTPRRIPAEFIRDSVLNLSGLIDHRMGGPPVRPYQPDGYYNLLNFPPRTYAISEGGNLYRRGVYTHWQRQFLHPMLRNFDAPSREECTAQRNRSNTPTQMLVLLNDPTFVEAARGFAWRVSREIDPVAADRNILIAEQLWLQALSRPPTLDERSILVEQYEMQRNYFRHHSDERLKFLNIGQWKAPDLDSLQEEELNELAAWSFTARSLFILNEFLTLY